MFNKNALPVGGAFLLNGFVSLCGKKLSKNLYSQSGKWRKNPCLILTVPNIVVNIALDKKKVLWPSG
jgi:hypothetical protein